MGFYPATGNSSTTGNLTVGGTLTANGGVVINAPSDTAVSALVINDTSGGRSGAAQLELVNDVDSTPIWAIPSAGGPKVFGDHLGSWAGVTTEAAQLLPWGGVQTGLSAGPTIYGGSGAPLPSGITTLLTDFGETANVGDVYIRTDETGTADERIYVCTAAGNPGTWSGIA